VITIYYSNGGSSTGIRYTELTDIKEIKEIIREKLREVGMLNILAVINVTPSALPAEKEL
jgi:hypothetical protein